DGVIRFDQQVQVVPLHGEVDHPEPEAILASAERAGDGAEAATATQARQAPAHSHGHVRRSLLRLPPRHVRHPGPRSLRLAPGTLPFPAPTPESDRKLPHLLSPQTSTA